MQYDGKKDGLYTRNKGVSFGRCFDKCVYKKKKKMIFIRTEYIKSLTALMEIYEKCDKSKER